MKISRHKFLWFLDYPQPIRGLLYDIRDWHRFNVMRLKYRLGIGPRPVCWYSHYELVGHIHDG